VWMYGSSCACACGEHVRAQVRVRMGMCVVHDSCSHNSYLVGFKFVSGKNTYITGNGLHD